MAEIIITVNGVEQVVSKFGRLQGVRFLRDPMQRAVIRLQRFMAQYPPAPANSRYRRTGTLGRRWTTQIDESGGGLQGKIGNNTRYAPFVQSKKLQSRHHAGRWQTDQDAVDRNRNAIVRDFEQAVREAVK